MTVFRKLLLLDNFPQCVFTGLYLLIVPFCYVKQTNIKNRMHVLMDNILLSIGDWENATNSSMYLSKDGRVYTAYHWPYRYQEK